MRLLIATDAWHPQVNGVVRTLMSLAQSLRKQGVTVEFLTPEGFPSIAVPTYRCLRLALPTPREIARRIEAAVPNAIHIATEGPIGHFVRRYCIKRGLPFTTSRQGLSPAPPAATTTTGVPHALPFASVARTYFRSTLGASS